MHQITFFSLHMSYRSGSDKVEEMILSMGLMINDNIKSQKERRRA